MATDTLSLYEDALAWSTTRRVTLPGEYYRTLSATARARAFSVAGLARLDALQGVMDSLDGAIRGGQTFAQWQRALLDKPELLQAAALPRHRLDNVFRTNMQAAYGAGIARQQESPGARARRPFFQYDAINDSRTRPAHAAMDNYIAPADDAVWRRWTPPCGYRCRCVRVALTAAEARARGWDGTTHAPPAEPDEGWGHHPLDEDGWRGVRQAIQDRLGKCDLRHGLFSNVRLQAPLWCPDGPARDNLLMHQTWAARKGAMPEPRALVLPELPPVQKGDESRAFARFMQEFGDESIARVELPSGDAVHVQRKLFKVREGADWKIGNRSRDRWLLYVAALIKAPQEIWRLQLGMTQELYLLGQFQRGGRRIDALAVFKREGDSGEWVEGKTAYVADRDDVMADKRRELLKKKAYLRWLEL